MSSKPNLQLKLSVLQELYNNSHISPDFFMSQYKENADVQFSDMMNHRDSDPYNAVHPVILMANLGMFLDEESSDETRRIAAELIGSENTRYETFISEEFRKRNSDLRALSQVFEHMARSDIYPSVRKAMMSFSKSPFKQFNSRSVMPEIEGLPNLLIEKARLDQDEHRVSLYNQYSHLGNELKLSNAEVGKLYKKIFFTVEQNTDDGLQKLNQHILDESGGIEGVHKLGSNQLIGIICSYKESSFTSLREQYMEPSLILSENKKQGIEEWDSEGDIIQLQNDIQDLVTAFQENYNIEYHKNLVGKHWRLVEDNYPQTMLAYDGLMRILKDDKNDFVRHLVVNQYILSNSEMSLEYTR